MKIIKLESEIQPILPAAIEVKIAVALMTEYSLELLIDQLDQKCKLKLLVGIDLLTPVEVFNKLLSQNNPNWEIKVFRKKAFFHPKLYIFKTDTDMVYVGSGNFTKAGISTNVELFSKLEGNEVEEFENWFAQYFNLGETLSQEFIDEYEPLFNDAVEVHYQAMERVRKIKRDLETGNRKRVFDLESCNFENQFFKFVDFNAFTGNKPYSFADNVNEERLEVKKHLFELHDDLYPLIKAKGWDLHPHEHTDHIISSYKHGTYTGDNLGALWLHYGRSPKDLKQFKKVYGDNQTSMYQMRLQVLVHAYDLSIWLRIGKNNGSIVDRTEFKKRMHIPDYRNTFYNMVKALPESYHVYINTERKNVKSFDSTEELHEFVRQDDIRNEYFIIGRKYLPNDVAISKTNINNTIMGDFELLYPIYLHIRTVI